MYTLSLLTMEGMQIVDELYNSDSCKAVTSSQSSASGNPVSTKEIQPIEYQSRTVRRFMSYTKIRTELLTREVLLRIYQLMNLKPGTEIKIMETPNYYIVQYADKCPILIHKKTGRLHIIENLGYRKEVMEHQASILLGILHRHGLVEGMNYKRIHVTNGGKSENNETPDTERLISRSNK